MSHPKDILDELSKDELLTWIRTQHYSLPKRSEILLARCRRQAKVLQAAMDAENQSLNGIDFTERDRLSVRLRDSTCIDERIRLMALLEPYGKAMSDHHQRCDVLRVKYGKLHELYDEVRAEQQKEWGLVR